MKKLISVLLALAIVLSLAPAAFADDVPTITMTADKESVAPGEIVTLTLSLDMDTVVDGAGFKIDFDKEAYDYVKRVPDTFDDTTNENVANEKGWVRFVYLNTKPSKPTTWSAGVIDTVTFRAKEGASSSTAKFTLTVENLEKYNADDPANNIKVAHNVVGGELTIPVEAPQVKGYTVSMGDDKQAAFGQTVEIPVTIGSTDDSVTGYNAYDMSFSYDSSALKLDMTETNEEGNRVMLGDNSVRIVRYGKEAALGEALTLKFEVLAGQGSYNVTVTSAKVDTNGNAIEADAPDATIVKNTATVTVSGYTVTLPDDFTRTDAEGSTIEAGGNLTFKPKDPNYDYNVTVTVGGETVTPTIGEDGTYTVPNVNGNVTVTSTKTPKSFNVTQGEDTAGAEKATYLTDYSFTLTPAGGYNYSVTVTIGGNTYTKFTSVANGDGSTTYTIPGADVTGEIVINSNKVVKPAQTFSVSFTGTGAGDATGASSVTENAAYTFTVTEQDGFEYTVTATMGGKAVTVTGSNGSYSIANVTGDLVITIAKKSTTTTMDVAVSKFVEMNNKTVFLVTVTGTPDEGKAFAYDGNVMYKTTAYGENVYSWLVIVDGTDLTAADAEAKITQSAAEAEEVTAGYDVNETGVVDINDAQLTYDIYTGKYTDFEKVSVRKFLRADATCDKKVNSADAVAVINYSK